MSEDIRPEAVQRIARILRDFFDEGVPAEIAKIVNIDDVGLEPAAAEVAVAEPQPERTAEQSVPRRIRMREALAILTRHSDGLDPSWGACFDTLTPDDLTRLRELYDVLPEPARIEYDRRHGLPSDLDDV